MAYKRKVRIRPTVTVGEGSEQTAGTVRTEPEPITEVVFRVWLGLKENGDGVIALFPYEQGAPCYCTSYEHVGQHGSADYLGLVGGGWDRRTRPAKPEEYKALKRELESEPYNYRLKVIKRVNGDRHRKCIRGRV